MSDQINFMWVGSSLTELGVLSLQSFNRLGYKCVLWIYDDIDNIPEYVEVKDADTILPLKEGRVSNFSDYFRYTLIYEHGGCYSDLDNIALNRLPEQEYLFSGNENNYTCAHLIRAPKGAEILGSIIEDIESSGGNFLLRSGKYLFEKVIEYNLLDSSLPRAKSMSQYNLNHMAREIIDWSNVDAYVLHPYESMMRVAIANSQIYKDNINSIREYITS